MKTNLDVHFRLHTATTIVLPLLLTTLTSSATLAQPPAGPGGFGGGPRGGDQGRPGGPGMSPVGRPGQASVADVPVTMLEPGLSLTADQKTKIAAIQQQFQKQRQTMRPGPGGFGGPGGGPGGPEGDPGGGPDGQGGSDGGPGGGPGGPGRPGGQGGHEGGPGGPGGPMDEMRELQQQTSKKIEALLTTTQKQALPTLLKEFDALRATGIPAETYGDLKLTADQKTKLAAIAQKAQKTMRQTMEKAHQGGDFESMRETMQQSRRQSQQEALSTLSTEQRQTVDKYRKAHPRPEGGPDGPPPPPPGN